MLVMALAMGFQPCAGFNYGAKNYQRLRDGFIYAQPIADIVTALLSEIISHFGETDIKQLIVLFEKFADIVSGIKEKAD
jgi:Na+-driven multidrug efflux pump